MKLYVVLILALIQGATELLPVSSSAHVIVAEKLLGLDPSSPEMTFLLVMLHTGTMFAVLAYFWKRWRPLLHARFIKAVVVATLCTGVVGFGLKKAIEKIVLEKVLGHEKGEVEHLFDVLPLIAVALVAAGALIFFSGRRPASTDASDEKLDATSASYIGVTQGLCLPFRGFSRSGATISVALFRGVPRALAEDFSFALAVVLTPGVVLLELKRLIDAKGGHVSDLKGMSELVLPGLIGMVASFVSGMLALRWLSSWLEHGKWKFFGLYCFGFAAVVLVVNFVG